MRIPSTFMRKLKNLCLFFPMTTVSLTPAPRGQHFFRFVFLATFIIAFPVSLSAEDETVIRREGPSYDRSEFQEELDEIPAERKKEKQMPFRGWAEYDFEVDSPGWYELWFGGAPPDWPRDVYVDGKLLVRLGRSSAEEDGKPDGKKDGANFKELNVYLAEGPHTLRYQRYGSPGVLPSVWELRPSPTGAGGSIRAEVQGSRIMAPGKSAQVKLTGGTSEPTKYELVLRDRLTDEETSVVTVEFPATETPIEKEVAVSLEKEGFFELLAKSDGKMLRPADLKGGFLLVAKPAGTASKKDKPLEMAGIFSDGAVLQQEKPLPVWGWAKPGQKVEVTLAEQTKEAVADADGRWQVTFDPIKAGGPYELKASSGANEVTVSDIMIGEVWVLSGQSNMGGPLLQSLGGMEEAKNADFPDVRRALVRGLQSPSGEWRPDVGWMGAVADGNAENLKQWIAIHYAFGTDIHKALGVPVGLISVNRGGTTISTWSSKALHEDLPSLRTVLAGYDADEKEHVSDLVKLNKLNSEVQKWREKAGKAKEQGNEPPAAPKLTAEIQENNAPAKNYEQLIEPLAPFAIRGFLWYQGESDSKMAAAYRERFPALIKSWRELWGDSKMPFIFAQLAYGRGDKYVGEPGDNKNSELKQVQLDTLSVPQTAMVVTNDLMRPGDKVHYPDKLPVGHRFALAALATVYGKDIEYSGPLYERMEIEGEQIRLHFKHVGDGLVAKDGELGGFAIAGEDRKWVWADAKIDGKTVVIRSGNVPKPVAVRYSPAEQPSGGNLFNQAGLPAAVFRTDDWPFSTEGVEWVRGN